MKKQSLWLDTAKAPRFPKLSQTVEVDVLVVGGGITGITTARLLKDAGLKVAVVDRQSVGGGETGHTTAHLTYVTDARLGELAKRVGEARAQAFWDAGRAAMGRIARLVNDLEIDCALRTVPGYLVEAMGRDDRPSLERDVALADKLGFDAAFLTEDPFFARPAVRFPNQLKFHPLAYLYAVARTIPGAGSHIFGQTVAEIEPDKHRMVTAGGAIKYDALVAATNVPIQGERGTLGAALFQTKLALYSTYAIAAEIPCQPEALFWDTNDPYLYLRFEKTKDGCMVIIGGEDHKTGQEDSTEECFARLEATLKKLLPPARPQYRWSGQVVETPDGLPYIGEVGERQFAATGFSGNGITLGTFSGMLIRDLITGKPNPWKELFDPRRKATADPWEYVRENVDYPVHLLAGHLRPAGALEDIRRCSGGIVRVDGKKCAVYVDEHGQRTMLSPVCPHLGCLVAWNDAEKTWDCPCHGSRFLAEGGLLAGPAESGLEKIEP